MLLIETNSPPWWRRTVLTLDSYYKPTTPRVPESLFSVALLTDLPAASKYPDCIALARDTGLVWSDGTNWVA